MKAPIICRRDVTGREFRFSVESGNWGFCRKVIADSEGNAVTIPGRSRSAVGLERRRFSDCQKKCSDSSGLNPERSGGRTLEEQEKGRGERTARPVPDPAQVTRSARSAPNRRSNKHRLTGNPERIVLRQQN